MSKKNFIASFKEQVYESTVYIRDGDYDKAIEIHKKCLSNDNPKDSFVHFKIIAHCYMWKGDTESAIVYGIKALEIKPHNFAILSLMAKCWSNSDNPDETYKYVCKILDITPPKSEHASVWLLWIFKPLSLLFERFRYITKNLENMSYTQQERNNELYEWARNYKRWYELER